VRRCATAEVQPTLKAIPAKARHKQHKVIGGTGSEVHRLAVSAVFWPHIPQSLIARPVIRQVVPVLLQYLTIDLPEATSAVREVLGIRE
jgi:hypothetical protein